MDGMEYTCCAVREGQGVLHVTLNVSHPQFHSTLPASVRFSSPAEQTRNSTSAVHAHNRLIQPNNQPDR